MHLDSDFPGGNIVVEQVEGDHVRLRQDWSGSASWWFYWAFRVREASGRSVHFQFCDGDALSAMGPCVSSDGINWNWLGPDAAAESGFRYDFAPHEQEVFFAFCPLYTQRHLEVFLEAHRALERREIGRSEGGLPLEELHLASESGRFCIGFSARTHACETMANFVLEGALRFWMEHPDAAWLRRHVDVYALPFMDVDGVERGEQGKNRLPHDHNRDWTQTPRYAATRAVMQAAPGWRGELAVHLDLHCPWIKGGRNDEIFFVGLAPPHGAELERFCSVLESSQRGPLPFDKRNNIAAGDGWNQGLETTTHAYFRRRFAPRFATSFEMPYALAGGRPVTPDGARAAGEDIARALGLYLQSA